MKKIIWNYNDIDSIKKAEKKKLTFENLGYRLIHTYSNVFTGESKLTYKVN